MAAVTLGMLCLPAPSTTARWNPNSRSGGAKFSADQAGRRGTLALACTDEHFQLSSLVVRFDNAIKPLGWFYPTDTAGPFKGLELGVALDKPWYSGFMPATVSVVARATCTYRPG